MSERIVELPSSRPLIDAYLQHLGVENGYAAELGRRLLLASATVYAYERDGSIQVLLPASGSESVDIWPMARTPDAEAWGVRALLERTLGMIGKRDGCAIVNAHVLIEDEDSWNLLSDAGFTEGREYEHDVTMSLAASGIVRARTALAEQQT